MRLKNQLQGLIHFRKCFILLVFFFMNSQAFRGMSLHNTYVEFFLTFVIVHDVKIYFLLLFNSNTSVLMINVIKINYPKKINYISSPSLDI